MKYSFKDITGILIPAERQRFFISIVLDVVIAVIDIVALALLLFIINFYSHPGERTPSFLPGYFFDRDTVLPVAVFLLLFAIKNLVGYYAGKAQQLFVYKVASRLSQKKLLQYLEGDYPGYVTIDSAVHTKKISQHPIEFGHYVLWGLQQIIAQAALISITVMAMVLFNTKLFLLLFIILLPPVILIAWLNRRTTTLARVHIKTSSEQALQYLKEAIAGFIESKIYDRNYFFTNRYAEKQQQLNQWLARLQALQGMPNRLIEVFAVLGFFVLLLLSRWTDNAVTPSIITIGAFMAAAYKIIPGVVKILNNSSMMDTYAYTIAGVTGNVSPAVTAQNNNATKITGVSYKDVSFNYADKNIIKHFTCVLRQGDFTGITGISGKGKTTLINLLLGFEDPAEGILLINEQPQDKLQRSRYWKNIAYVKQQPFLIHDTILNNIILGKENIDAQQLTAAIAAAGLQELIAQYPEGLNKIVTENGKNISGGQRQRIVIARALYKNADLILLDEPFNELDNASENKLLEYFKLLAVSGKIVVLITHNKTSLAFCNSVISLDEN